MFEPLQLLIIQIYGYIDDTGLVMQTMSTSIADGKQSHKLVEMAPPSHAHATSGDSKQGTHFCIV
jgi:hypothetical protein